MDTDRFLDSSDLPELRRPVLLAAFAGWNDAGQAATFALSALRTLWSAKRFAGIDPEEFFDFTESRPMISLTPQGQRSLEWPLNEFYAHEIPEAENDVVLLIGTEPQLKWRSFCQVVQRVAEQLDASCLLTLGALLADVPHTVAPRVTGFSTVPSGSVEFKTLGITTSSYEGPTGILGVLHDSWRRLDRPGVSLWGNVPALHFRLPESTCRPVAAPASAGHYRPASAAGQPGNASHRLPGPNRRGPLRESGCDGIRATARKAVCERAPVRYRPGVDRRTGEVPAESTTARRAETASRRLAIERALFQSAYHGR